MPGQEEFIDTCELFGFYILVPGLFIECSGELMKFVDTQYRAALLIFRALSIALNVSAMGFLLRLIARVARLQLSEPAH